MNNAVGVMIIGLKGAVSTTLVSAGIAARYGLSDRLTLPSEQDPTFADLAFSPLEAMRFGGWDVAEASMAESLLTHKVLPIELIEAVKPHLGEVWSAPGISLTPTPILDQLDPANHTAQPEVTGHALVNRVRHDIQSFKTEMGVEEVVVLDLSSTAPVLPKNAQHTSIEALDHALTLSVDDAIDQALLSEGVIYAYAAILEGCPCINFTPSTTFDIPALLSLAEKEGVVLCGKDGKTGQTLYKTAIAPLFKQRALHVSGWYSTNILGNRDGEVLHHPEHRQTKLESKTGVLNEILGEADLDHQVHIHYYRPRGDAKEAWDNIDFEGWFGVPMQMKINWLGSDSILAAPLAADLVRWALYFHRRGDRGIIPSLASYFKTPLGGTTHDFFAQVEQLRAEIKGHLSSTEH